MTVNPSHVFNELVDELYGLDTHRKIAGFLKDKGIQGTRGDFSYCPISTYLLTEIRGECPIYSSDVMTTEGAISLRALTEGHTIREDREMTSAIADFVTVFDGGHYPELDKNRGE